MDIIYIICPPVDQLVTVHACVYTIVSYPALSTVYARGDRLQYACTSWPGRILQAIAPSVDKGWIRVREYVYTYMHRN